ncbi:MAG: GtrA family protein [Actinobacteria bacterium]|nr:GtrA family protein [Actinomycetota bacterium]
MRLLRAVERRLGATFTRYAAGSVVATAISQATFVALYASRVVGPGGASVIAFAAGVPPNYVLNRRWAWRARGRPSLAGELVPYVSVILLTAAAAAMATRWTDRQARALTSDRAWQVVLVTGSFIATTAVSFVVKYVLLDRLVFRRRRRGGRPGAAPASTSGPPRG